MSVSVSIITATYNSEKNLGRTMKSVLNQTVPPKEYIIMDGASDDKTVKIAESFRKDFEEKGIDLIIKSEPDGGMYDAINKAIDIATGDIIGNVNSDDFYEPCAIETVEKTYRKTKFDMMYANLRVVKPTGNFIKKAKFKKFATTRYWNHPTTFITKEVYNKHKYKCESMYDDCDLMLRLRREGFKIVVVDKILSNFNFGGMSTQKSIKDMVKRIGLRCKIYKNNGYGFIYFLDSAVTEFAKYILA